MPKMSEAQKQANKMARAAARIRAHHEFEGPPTRAALRALSNARKALAKASEPAKKKTAQKTPKKASKKAPARKKSEGKKALPAAARAAGFTSWKAWMNHIRKGGTASKRASRKSAPRRAAKKVRPHAGKVTCVTCGVTHGLREHHSHAAHHSWGDGTEHSYKGVKAATYPKKRVVKNLKDARCVLTLGELERLAKKHGRRRKR